MFCSGVNIVFYVALTLTNLLSFENYYVAGHTLTEETSLHNTLTSGYLRALRPGEDRSQPVQVNVSFSLRSIKEVEETTGKFSVIGDFVFTWIDERLTWTPSSNGYLNHTTFLQSQVWIPDLMCTNPYSQVKGLSVDQGIVQYEYTGLATWMPGNIFESTCDADVTFYPYDSQTCTLSFMSWGYKSTDVYLNPTSTTSSLTHYSKSGLWVLKSSKLYIEDKGNDFQSLNLQYSLKRRSTFHLVNLLMPMCIMGMLHIFVFILPEECGERVGYSVTVLLALAVYMSIVAENLPESSEPNLSILSIKLLADIILGSILMVLTIVGLKFYHVEESKKISKFLQRFTKLFTSLPCKKTSNSDNIVSVLKTDDISEEKKISKSENEDITWALVAKAFDNFCLIFAILLNMAFNMFFGLTVFTAP